MFNERRKVLKTATHEYRITLKAVMADEPHGGCSKELLCYKCSIERRESGKRKWTYLIDPFGGRPDERTKRSEQTKALIASIPGAQEAVEELKKEIAESVKEGLLKAQLE